MTSCSTNNLFVVFLYRIVSLSNILHIFSCQSAHTPYNSINLHNIARKDAFLVSSICLFECQAVVIFFFITISSTAGCSGNK